MPKSFTVSELADKDLEDIFDYTFHEFGLEQASKYLNEIDLVHGSLALQELIGLSRLEINEEIRSFVYRYRLFFLQNYFRTSNTHVENHPRQPRYYKSIYKIVIFKYCQCGSIGLSSSTSWMVLSIGYTLNTISLSDIQKESETLELTAQD
jgi:plasmid stabilization system protein ParE